MEQNYVKIKPITAIAILFQLVFMIFVVITLRDLLTEDQTIARVAIDDYSAVNLDSFPLDDTKKTVIEGELNSAISFNGVDSFLNKDAKIRDGSVHSISIKDLDVEYLSFIIDVESIKQSYRLVYRDTDTYPNRSVPENGPAMVFCLRNDEKIYGDFDCKDDYSDNVEDQIVYSMVRYKTFSNFTVGIIGDVYNGESISFRINTMDDEETTINAAVSEFSKYLSSLGFDLNNYEYEAMSYSCCGT